MPCSAWAACSPAHRSRARKCSRSGRISMQTTRKRSAQPLTPAAAAVWRRPSSRLSARPATAAPFAPLTPVHIELRQNEVNWYNRVFGWLPFVDSANDIRRENRRLQNEYRAAQRASDLSFGGNPFEDEIEYSDAVLKPRYRLHRCGLPQERLAIPAQPPRPAESGRSTARASCPCCSTTAASIPRSRAFPYLCQGAVRRAAHRGRISRQESECARQKPAQQPGLVCPDYHADHLQRCPPQRHRPSAEPRARADRTRAAPP